MPKTWTRSVVVNTMGSRCLVGMGDWSIAGRCHGDDDTRGVGAASRGTTPDDTLWVVHLEATQGSVNGRDVPPHA